MRSLITSTLLAGLAFVLVSCDGADIHDRTKRVCLDNACVTVEIAYTPEEVRTGLMHRTSLPRDAGMLFVFSNSTPRRFWMKNTLIPLDMIWLNDNRQIIYIQHQVPPCETERCPSYGPNVPARYVLEVNSGVAREMGMTVGKTLDFIIPTI